jgi:hypothetical protein
MGCLLECVRYQLLQRIRLALLRHDATQTELQGTSSMTRRPWLWQTTTPSRMLEEPLLNDPDWLLHSTSMYNQPTTRRRWSHFWRRNDNDDDDEEEEEEEDARNHDSNDFASVQGLIPSGCCY